MVVFIANYKIYIYIMKIVFYTNCQYRGIHLFLKKSLDYTFVHIENYSLIRNKKDIPFDILKSADIFIYQPIDKKHGVYSTDQIIENNIMSYLQQSCTKISFPYIYNSSLWILLPPAIIDGYIGDYPDINKYVNREPIEKLKNNQHSLSEVLEIYKNGDLDFEYEVRFNKSIAILRKKESICF